jgi:hypothetical protein
LQLIDVRDDARHFTAKPGRFTCPGCVANGDVNHDGALSPADARCAFEAYLGNGVVPVDCDVNGFCEIPAADADCDGHILPSDALAIFHRWLYNVGGPLACFAHTPGGDPEAFRIDPSRAVPVDAGVVAVPVERRAGAGEAAFAAQIEFDPSRMQFVAFEPAGSESWVALDARLASPGSIRVGGFAVGLASPADAAWIPIGQLLFRRFEAAAAIAAVNEITVYWQQRSLTDPQSDPPATESIATMLLGAPYPNPARGRDVSFEIAVPADAAAGLEIEVVDVRGRVVQRLRNESGASGRHLLHWDRTDAQGRRVAAGLYLVRARSGAHLAQRKFVVLD